MTIVVVGAYTLDLYMFGDRLPGLGETVNCGEFAEAHGGKGANQAVAARRMGASTALVARLGSDPVGENAVKLFRDEGLDISRLAIAQGERTGASFVIVDQAGLQIITTYAGASFTLTQEDVHRAHGLLHAASVILLQGEIDPAVSLEAARLAGPSTRVVLDPSPVEAFPDAKVFETVDILTPNEQEAVALTGLAAPGARDVADVCHTPVVLLTCGAGGVEVYDHGRTYQVSSSLVDNVVDTTGAGDAFNGALAAGLDLGMDLRNAVELACRYASQSVAGRFCIPSYPRLEDLHWNLGKRL
jgi:ribokinase